MGAEGGHPGFCRKLYSPLLIKNPIETAHVSKALAKTEGNGSYPLLRKHQSNFWNWRYNYDRVLWLSLLTARLSATLCRQSGTGDLHSAAFFQVILFSERRHSTEWPSISQLWIQVPSQQILDELCLERTLWCASELAVVEAESDFCAWSGREHGLAPGTHDKSKGCGKHHSLFMHHCGFYHW